jgi:DNA-binding cell septation regulator SpoVG
LKLRLVNDFNVPVKERKKKMSIESIQVQIRRSSTIGKVKAHADVTLLLPGGVLRMLGFSVIQLDGKPPFVGVPSRPGKTPGKFFPIVELQGAPLEAVTTAVLEAYERSL